MQKEKVKGRVDGNIDDIVKDIIQFYKQADLSNFYWTPEHEDNMSKLFRYFAIKDFENRLSYFGDIGDINNKNSKGDGLNESK